MFGILAVAFVAGCTQTGQIIGITPDITECRGNVEGCFYERITYVRDGATLETPERMIRLALVDAPSRDSGYFDDATNLTFSNCAGRIAFIDLDDAQPTDPEGRNVAVVYCDGGRKSTNQQLIELGYAKILAGSCGTSEFAAEPWAKMYGC
jgi:endonuclease YncB( thermonuclease family)